MNNIKNYIITGLGLTNAVLVSFFGVFTPLLYTVLLLMFFDLISRMYAAGMRSDEKIESKKVISGLGSKFGMIMLIILGLIIDSGLSMVFKLVLSLADIAVPISIIAVMPFTLAWIFVRESTSICENLQHAGIKVPPFIVKALNVTNTALDKANDMIGGKDHENI